MYLVYVDESGDSGLVKSPTQFFVLSALVVHELHWLNLVTDLKQLRQKFRQQYGLKLREEIHAAHFFSKPGPLARIAKHDRLAICRKSIDFIENLGYVKLVNVVVDKTTKSSGYDVFEHAWQALVQRIENTLNYHNFTSGYSKSTVERAMILPDRTDDKKLRSLVRRMRVYNPVPNTGASGYRQLALQFVVEDPQMMDSSTSFITQMTDVNAYFLYQAVAPNGYIRKKKASNYFLRYNAAVVKQASKSCKWGRGVVWL